MTYLHQHAAHCESGVAAGLLRHHGVPLTESLAFGLAAGLSFAYLPFVKLSGLPLVAYRSMPRAVLKGAAAAMDTRFRFETFRTPASGRRRLDALLAEGRVVGLQTSVYWLPYFPPDMRFHFNAHNLVVYGRDGDDYLVSDPVFEDPQRCAAADLDRARFTRGLLAPRGLLYYPCAAGPREITPSAVRAALRRNARQMLAPVPIAGVRGMRLLARTVRGLRPGDPHTAAFLGHLVRMQEEIGTGGAGFRFLYAAFLQEAAELGSLPALRDFADRLTVIGDGWRRLALQAARMVKGRDTMDPPAVAASLREQADQEEAFFRDLNTRVSRATAPGRAAAVPDAPAN